jgi:thioesterase domain-containing protein
VLTQAPAPLQPESAPLSEVQQAYWVGERRLYELSGAAAWYAEFSGSEIDVERFEWALARAIAHHAMLRTIVTADARLRVLAETPKFPLVFEDLRRRSGSERARLHYWQERLRASVGPLDRWPLFNVTLLHTSSESRLLVAGHQIVLDAASRHILWRDLGELYHTGKEGLRPVRYSFPDYAEELASRNARAASELAAHQYGEGRLAALPLGPALPTVATDETRESTPIRHLALELSGEERGAIERRACELDVSTDAAFCAAFSTVIAGWSASSRFMLVVLYPRRRPLHPDVPGLVGNFEETLLLEVELEGVLANDARRIQARLSEALEQAETCGGLSLLRELMRRRPETSRVSLAPIVFTLESGFDAGPPSPRSVSPFGSELGWRAIDSTVRLPHALIEHRIRRSPGEFFLGWSLRDAFLAPDVGDAMFAAYGSLLKQMASGGAEFWASPLPPLFPTAPDAVRAGAAPTAPQAAPAPLLPRRRDRPIERILRGIWSEVLGHDPGDSTRGFWDAGGHSVLAIQMLVRVEQVFGVQLRRSLASENASIERLAMEVADSPRPRSGNVVCMRPTEGEAEPIFCVHSFGGDVGCYWPLARLWQRGACFGIQARRPEPLAKRPATGSIAELARVHAGDVNRLQPSGPLRLLGWSLGALIALELGRALVEKGRTVGVVMIDPRVPIEGKPPWTSAELLFAGLSDLGARASEALRPELEHGDPSERLAKGLAALARDEGSTPGDAAALDAWQSRFERHARALEASEPVAAPLPTLLLEAAEATSVALPGLQPAWRSTPWRSALRDCQREIVPREHATLLDHGAGELAPRLGEFFGRIA